MKCFCLCIDKQLETFGVVCLDLYLREQCSQTYLANLLRVIDGTFMDKKQTPVKNFSSGFMTTVQISR